MEKITVSLSVDRATELLQQAILAFPMGLVAHINGQANAAKRGITVPADQILEVFRPDFAIRVWQAEKSAGIDIPLRIHVYEQDGKTHVAYRTPAQVFAPYANAQLNAVAAELGPIFKQIVSTLDKYKEAS